MTRRVTIIGNPNCGKTTLFNKLTGAKQKVGNWSGVTVDKKTGYFNHQDIVYELIDLPGIYSSTVVNEASIDERIACDFLLQEHSDLIINIVDAANLKRNFYLTAQLLEMNIPCIVAVNMIDVAENRQLIIDYQQLEKQLGCPVVPLVSSKNKGLEQLKTVIANYQTRKSKKFSYQQSIETTITQLSTVFEDNNINYSRSLYRFLAIRLLEQDIFITDKLAQQDILSITKKKIDEIALMTGEEADILIADGRYQFADQVFNASVQRVTTKQKTITQRIDQIVTNRWLGIPIFLLIMYLMFEFSMNIGTLLQPLFDISSTTIFIDGVAHLGHHWGLPLWLIAVLSQGIGLGINTVVNFIPQIGLMFLFLSLLEDSGYMARAAFVMDRFMQAVGLPGKSFVPLIVGFGCNVPAIMATRTLNSKRDRILTCMMSPFMSCGARLAIFVVFASAFFPQHAGLMVFLLYIIGILAALLTGFLLKTTVLRGEPSPFILELPVYHLPVVKNILYVTWSRLKRFIFRAGKVIVPICLLVGTLNTIQPNGKMTLHNQDNSILADVGKAITPIFAPMGVKQDNWPATVGLMTGVLAKEVVVGTLNSLYSQNNGQLNSKAQNFHFLRDLKSAVTITLAGLKNIFSTNMINPFTANEADHQISKTAINNMVMQFASPVAAFAYLLFVLLYIPCISTIGVLIREVGKVWAWGSTLWSFNVAYVLAVVFYQASQIILNPLSASLWILGLLLVQTIIFLTLRKYSNTSTIKDVRSLQLGTG